MNRLTSSMLFSELTALKNSNTSTSAERKNRRTNIFTPPLAYEIFTPATTATQIVVNDEMYASKYEVFK
jgi:hypothetical protein